VRPSLTITGMYNVLEKLRSGEALTAKDKAQLRFKILGMVFSSMFLLRRQGSASGIGDGKSSPREALRCRAWQTRHAGCEGRDDAGWVFRPPDLLLALPREVLARAVIELKCLKIVPGFVGARLLWPHEEPSPPKAESNEPNVFLIGQAGVGKSSLGKVVAERVKRHFFDLDEEVERFYRKSLDELRRDFPGVHSYRAAKSDVLLSELAEKMVIEGFDARKE